jgi:hypothetical protein
MGLSLIGTLASGAMSAYGAYSQGKSQESQYLWQANQYERQAAVAENNRKMAQAQASEALDEGAREERRFRLQARQFQSSQEAKLAASGVTMSGSAANVLADTAQGIEEDAVTLRYNALKSKWGFDVEGTNWLNEANAARTSAETSRASARGAKAAGWMGVGSSLLGTAASLWGQSEQSSARAAAKGNSITVDASPNNYLDPWNYRGFNTVNAAGGSVGKDYAAWMRRGNWWK